MAEEAAAAAPSAMEEGKTRAHAEDTPVPEKPHTHQLPSHDDVNNSYLDQSAAPTVQTRASTKRVAALDAFRGLTIAVMILVDDAGGEWSQINHSPWNGCTLADFVMPFFLFIVGVAIAIAFKRVTVAGPAMKKVFVRFLKLLFWGILLQGGYSHAPDDLSYGVDMTHIRWCGILQRIAVGYAVVAVIEIIFRTKYGMHTLPKSWWGVFQVYKWHWVVALCIIVIYVTSTYAIYVPDWHFQSSYTGEVLTVICGTRANFGPACNAVGYIDRKILGLNHLYSTPEWTRSLPCDVQSPDSITVFRPGAPSWCQAPFEPEGIMSTFCSIISVTLGVHYGHVLIHYKEHKERLIHWVIPGFVLVPLSLILHYSHAIYLNKQLYSVSYLLLTGGAAGLVFSALYTLIDVFGVRKPTLMLEWMGMNAMFVFVFGAEAILAGFVNGWYYKTPNNTLVHWIMKHIFILPWHSVKVGTLLYVLFAEILFWGLASGLLHWQGMYWKL